MQVEGLACCVVGVRQCFVTVVFTDEHAECRNGMPVALVRGCAVARDQGELARLLCPGTEPVGVQLYVEPDTTQAEITSLWMAGFRVKLVRVSEVFSVPGWWFNGKILRRKTFSRVQLKVLQMTMPVLRRLDGLLPWGGLSLIAVVVRD